MNFNKALSIPLFLLVLGFNNPGAFAISTLERLKKEESWEQRFIQSNIAISHWFDSAAEGLDLFLVGQRRTTKKLNESQFRIENTTVTTEGKDATNRTDFNFNLRLPNVEKYWQLKFTSYDEREEKRNVRRSYLRRTQRERNYGATLGLFKKLGNIKTSFEPRIELRDPLKVSHSISFESVADMKTYIINPELEFFASPSRGVGTSQALNFNFILSKYYTLTFINQGEYFERTHLYQTINGFSLGQIIDTKRSLAYSLLFDSNNRPDYHLQAYNISVAWHEEIYRRIFDYQIVPNIDFNKDNSFKPLLGLTINLNLNF